MLVTDSLSFQGRHATLVPATTVEVRRGELLLVQGETQESRTALSLMLSGRMKPNSGRVSWQGSGRTRDIRRASALLDSPGVNEPESYLKVKDLVKEDLALIPTFTWNRVLPMRWLESYHQEGIADQWIDQLSPTDRLDLLVNLALADPDVHLVVCDSPERHGATDEEWLRRLVQILIDHERDVAVVAVVSVIPAMWDGPYAIIGNAQNKRAQNERAQNEKAQNEKAQEAQS
ncbi:hypothetical protein M3G03_01255 [Aestuariimicrobium sp. p3-SID1156]|uniref:hypothetical protein n=1 Tax=Aestuariimicrobium sp. p3-SID1156 TaxID=2916038 RepID=UPI00223AC271|nr:hypothetical protein [Aestuariimicrobium sp. p3-SID1156]MCT1458182.1 hypothetical protein [Aestuariimicrobium sp. p3-SID1156]